MSASPSNVGLTLDQISGGSSAPPPLTLADISQGSQAQNPLVSAPGLMPFLQHAQEANQTAKIAALAQPVNQQLQTVVPGADLVGASPAQQSQLLRQMNGARAHQAAQENALAQAQQQAEAIQAQKQIQHPVTGTAENIANAVGQGLVAGKAGLMGLFNPKEASEAEQGEAIEQPAPPGVQTTVGKLVGGVLPTISAAAIPGAGPVVAAGLMGGTQAGQTRNDIATQRAAGANISPTAESGYALAQGAIGVGTGLLFGKLGSALDALSPVEQQALQTGSQSVISKALNLGLQGTKLAGQDALIGGATTAIQNKIAQGYDPQKAITEGLGETMASSAILGPLMHGLNQAGETARENAPSQNEGLLDSMNRRRGMATLPTPGENSENTPQNASANPAGAAESKPLTLKDITTPAEMEHAAANVNPEIVPKNLAAAAAPESHVADLASKSVDQMNQAELKAEVSRLRGVQETPNIHPATEESGGITQHYQQGENWRQNVSEHDLKTEPPIVNRPFVPNPEEQTTAYNKAMVEDVNTANKANNIGGTQEEPTAPAPYKTLPEIPSAAKAWSPDEIRSWAEKTGYDLAGLPASTPRSELLDQLRESSGRISNPEGAEPTVNPHTSDNAAAQFLRVQGIDNPSPEQIAAVKESNEPYEGLTKAQILGRLAEPQSRGPMPEAAKIGFFQKHVFSPVTNALRASYHPEGTNEITRTLASSEADRMMLANKISPWVDAAKNLSPDEAIRAVDQLDKTGHTTVEAMKGFQPIQREINDYFKNEFAKAGVDTSDWTNHHLTYGFIKPEGMDEGTYQNRVGRAENFLKQRGNYSYADAIEAAAHLGLGYEKNPVLMQARQWGGMADALAFRNMLQDAVKKGLESKTLNQRFKRAVTGGADAMKIGADEKLPAGWSELPSQLANDQLFNQATGESTEHAANRIVVSPGLRAAIDGYFANKDVGSGLQQVFSGARKLRFLFDTVNASRAPAAMFSDMLAKQLAGPDVPDDPIWSGRQAIAGSLNPEKNSLLQFAMKEGGFRNDFLPTIKKLEGPGSLPEKSYNGTAYMLKLPQRFASMAKLASVINAAHDIVNNDALDDSQKSAKMKDAVYAADRKYGMAKTANTLPPMLNAAKSAFAPLIDWVSSEARLAATATHNKTALRHVVGDLVAIAASGGLLTYLNTKHAPQNFQDWVRPPTGGKNEDGSAQRAKYMASWSPLVDDMEAVDKGEWQKILTNLPDPLTKAVAEAALNVGYNGKPIGGIADRVKHIGEAGATLLPDRAKFWESKEQQNRESQGINTPAQIFGERPAPLWEERTPFMNAAQDIRNDSHTPLTPEQQAAQKQRFDWMDRVATPALAKQNGRDVATAMTNAGYDIDQTISLLESARQPHDAGWMGAHLEPDQLNAIWDKADSSEQTAIRQALVKRLANVDLDREAPNSVKSWGALIRKVRRQPAPK